MTLDISREANLMADRFTCGALSDIARHFSFPAAVYFGERILILTSELDLKRSLQAYRSILMKCGLSLIGSRVLGTPTTRRDRFTVSVANSYFSVSGGEIGQSRIRYYLQSDPAGACAKVRLVEYLEWPCPKQVAENSALASIEERGKARAIRAAAGAWEGDCL